MSRQGVRANQPNVSTEKSMTAVARANKEDDRDGRHHPDYVVPVLQKQQYGDEDSHVNAFFMSEPSMSTDGCDSDRVRAPHKAADLGLLGLPRQQQSADEGEGPDSSPEEAMEQRTTPQKTQKRKSPRTQPVSPGNSSLSSWASSSPAVTKTKVLFQFALQDKQTQEPHLTVTGHPTNGQYDRRIARRKATNNAMDGGDVVDHGRREEVLPQHQMPPLPNIQSQSKASKQHAQDAPSSNSTSSASAGQVQRGEEFLQALRQQSAGFLHEEAAGLLDDSILNEETAKVDSVLRNTAAQSGVNHVGSNEDPSKQGASRLSTSMDDSVDMTWSDSEIGDSTAIGDDSLRYSGHTLEGEEFHAYYDRFETPQHDAAADDEKTAERKPRVRGNGKAGHRRTRSGDAAAATLATGGSDWKGMEQDQIPLPEEADDDDDEHLVGDEEVGLRDATPNLWAPQLYYRQQAETTHLLDPRHSKENGQGGMGGQYGSGLPPMQDHQRADHPRMVHWASPPDGGHGAVDSRQAWLKQMSQCHSQNSIGSYSQSSGHGSMHSVAEVPSEGDDEEPMSIHKNRISFTPSLEGEDLEEVEHRFEKRQGTQNVLRSRHNEFSSPFANFGKKSADKVPRSAFLPEAFVGEDDEKKYPTYICPRCKTRQRAFFTVENAETKIKGPTSYLALYFAVYVICSLFIFGLEEGWMPLDCVYFAVVTLTTAGLGDFVPTTDANKIICSIFIYFGVACIGLLLGTYIAGMLDDKASRDREANQIESCPSCAKIEMMKDAQVRRAKEGMYSSFSTGVKPESIKRYQSERVGVTPPQSHPSAAVYVSGHHHHHGSKHVHMSDRSATSWSSRGATSPAGLELSSPATTPSTRPEGSGAFPGVLDSNSLQAPASPMIASSSPNNHFLGSPVTRQILGRQRHTRHGSIDIAHNDLFPGGSQTTSTMRFQQTPTINETTPLESIPSSAPSRTQYSGDDAYEFTETDDDESSETSSSASSAEELMDPTKFKILAAKFVFLTLRKALVNSLLIISVGCVGFWIIEGFSLVDSWYFTTVFLTTVGYGDITPVTKGGKLFATVYILVAGTILLNNMSTISMIPLELRRRRIERAVLTQFGDQLDDAALRELATGPLIQRLRLSANRSDGLDECTREMFALAMLVRLGKVTESDIRGTFASFQRLDVNNEGVLNSKSIIAGMIMRSRNSQKDLTANIPAPPLTAPPPPDSSCSEESEDGELPEEEDQDMEGYWFGQHGSLHVSAQGHNYHFNEASRGADHERSSLMHRQRSGESSSRSSRNGRYVA